MNYPDTVLILHLFVFFTNLFLGFIVIRKAPKVKTNLLFGVYAISLAMWNFSLFMTITEIGGPTLQLWWSRLAFSFYLLMLNSFLFFVIIYPIKKQTKDWFFYAFWIITIGFFILTLTPLLVAGDIKIINGFITGTLGPLIGPFSIYYTLTIIVSLLILFIKNWKYKGINKIKLAYITIGFSVFAIPMIITNMILPVFFLMFQYNNLGPLFSFPMLAIIGYAIVKYRFLDIEVIIKKGVIFSIIFGSITTVFITSILFAGEIIGQTYALVLAATIVTIGFVPFKEFIEKITNKLFFKRQYQLKKALEDFNNLLISEHDLNDLLKKTAQKIKDYLQTETVTFVLRDDNFKKFHTSNVFGDRKKLKIEKQEDLINYLSNQKNTEAFLDEKTKIIFQDHLEYKLEHLHSFKNGTNKKIKAIYKLMNKKKFEAIVPIYSHNSNGKLIGFLIISKKKSDDPFYDKDISLIDQITKEVVYPIEHSEVLRKLQQTDKIKTEFINVLSLHLRTPLSSALWDLEILLDGDVGKINKKTVDYVKEIHNKLNNLNGGLNSLFTSLEISEKIVNLKKDPNEFFQDILTPVLEKTEINAKAKDIKIKISTQSKEITINCDAKKIKNILEVLISNAIDYSPKKSTIIISAEINTETDKFIMSVQDEGVGVSTKNKELIFEKFFRGNEIKKIKPEGLGVDLFISRKFAQKHGGNLWCEGKNKKIKGAKFILEIPSK